LTTAEDLIFLDRLKNSGARFVIVKDAVVSWSLPRSLGAVYRRLSGYSRGGLAAGFASTWHYGTARLLSIYLLLAAGGVFVHPAFAAGAVVLHFVRVHRYLNRMKWLRHGGAAGAAANYALSAVMLAVIDAATINGLWRWVISDGCCRKEITRVS
jgi:hypothetical protein